MFEAVLEPKTNLDFSFSVHIWIEVVSWSTDHDNKCAAVFKESGNPQNTEQHVEAHVFQLFIHDKIFTLDDIFINFDMTHWDNSHHRSNPNQNWDDWEKEE